MSQAYSWKLEGHYFDPPSPDDLTARIFHLDLFLPIGGFSFFRPIGREEANPEWDGQRYIVEAEKCTPFKSSWAQKNLCIRVDTSWFAKIRMIRPCGFLTTLAAEVRKEPHAMAWRFANGNELAFSRPVLSNFLGDGPYFRYVTSGRWEPIGTRRGTKGRRKLHVARHGLLHVAMPPEHRGIKITTNTGTQKDDLIITQWQISKQAFRHINPTGQLLDLCIAACKGDAPMEAVSDYLEEHYD